MERIPKITSGWRSKSYPQYSMSKLIVEKVEWVLNNEVRNLPHLAWISVRQLIFGEGMHWKNKECPKHVKMGLLNHLKMYRASNKQRSLHFYRTKWEIPDLPEDLYTMIKNVVKGKIINPILKGEGYDEINPLWARGYISSNSVPPLFDESKSRDLVGWFFYLNDPDTFSTQKKFLENMEGKNRNIACQFKYNSVIFQKQLREQYAAISSRLELLDFCSDEKFEAHKQIAPKLSDEEITWDDPDDEEGEDS